MIKTPYCGRGDCKYPDIANEMEPKQVTNSQNVRDVIEDIQKAQVDAGGRFIKQNEISNMTVKELLNLLVPNNVKFNIYYQSSTPLHDKGD